MTRYIFISYFFWVLSAATYVSAQTPNWSVNSSSYQYSMTVTAALSMDYTETTSANDIIAAFIGGECRGVAKPIYIKGSKRWIAFLVVYNNSTTDTVSFKLYNATKDKQYDVEKTKLFTVNATIGTAAKPLVVSSPTLSDEANILTFNITNELRQQFNGFDITVEMPYGTDFTQLVPQYTTSHLALVKIDTLVQTSAVSKVDFSTPKNYWIRSADETLVNNYNIKAIVGNSAPTDISIANDTVLETLLPQGKVTTLTTADIDVPDTHVYSLVTGTGDEDNSAFFIKNDSLCLDTLLDFESGKTTYNIRVKSDDQRGGTVEKSFVINVIDQNDEAPESTIDTTVFFDENTINQEVFAIIASDYDVHQQFGILKYKQVDSVFNQNFELDSLTGKIKVIAALDYEKQVSFPLSINISDSVNTTTIRVVFQLKDLNDEFPNFGHTTVNIGDNAVLDTELAVFKAIDLDANSVITYTASDNFEGTFNLTTDGVLTLTKYLDFDTKSEYKFTVTAFDGKNETTKDVTINVAYFEKTNFVANKIVSPNHDLYLDTWVIEQPHVYRDCLFQIFSPRNEIVFQQTGYFDEWDGNYKNLILPIGAYYYIITTPRNEKITGVITLIR